MSAALGLAHEMGHVAQHLDGELNSLIKEETDIKYKKVERANLKKYETPIAGQLGEPTRFTYNDIRESRRMNNSIHYITKYNDPYKFWKVYAWQHNVWPIVGTTIGPAK